MVKRIGQHREPTVILTKCEEEEEEEGEVVEEEQHGLAGLVSHHVEPLQSPVECLTLRKVKICMGLRKDGSD